MYSFHFISFIHLFIHSESGVVGGRAGGVGWWVGGRGGMVGGWGALLFHGECPMDLTTGTSTGTCVGVSSNAVLSQGY
jgi:hypothetical protein